MIKGFIREKQLDEAVHPSSEPIIACGIVVRLKGANLSEAFNEFFVLLLLPLEF